MEKMEKMVSGILSQIKTIIESAEAQIEFVSDVRVGHCRFFDSRIIPHLIRIYGADHPVPKKLEQYFDDSDVDLQRRVDATKEFIRVIESFETDIDQIKKDLIFIGHGKSATWHELRDFIESRLGLPWEAFDRDRLVGLNISEQMQKILNRSAFAFIVLTGSDCQQNGSVCDYIIHEIGLCQGRLGLNKVIILIESGVDFPSWLLDSTIVFKKNNISAKFEDVRRILEREKRI